MLFKIREVYRSALHNQSNSLKIVHKVPPEKKNVSAVNRSKETTKMETRENVITMSSPVSITTNMTFTKLSRTSTPKPTISSARPQIQRKITTSTVGIDWNNIDVSYMTKLIAPTGMKQPKKNKTTTTATTTTTTTTSTTTTMKASKIRTEMVRITSPQLTTASGNANSTRRKTIFG